MEGGINPKQIRFLANNHPKLKGPHLKNLSDHEVLQFIFTPGLSSKMKAQDLSGRGVGMDAVKTEIEKVGGTVEVKSEVDKGTVFIAKLPQLIPFIKS